MTAIDSTKVSWALAALAAPALLAAVLAYVSSGVNRPPVVVTWVAEPASIAHDGTAVVRASAFDADGGALRYEYQAERGHIEAEPAQPSTAHYRPPADGATSDRVTVTVTDDRGLTARAETRIAIAAPARAATPVEPTPLPVPAAIETPVPTRIPAPVVAETAPPRPTSTPMRVEPPPPAEPVTRAVNHAPVLDKGTTIENLGTRSVVLVANGYEPDGDIVEHVWDTKGCFDVLNESPSSIEVKFGYCTWGVVTLTWRDPHGMSATAEWTISK